MYKEPSGVFLDFAEMVPERVGLVAHAMADEDWITGGAITDVPWFPERGPAPRRLLQPCQDILSAFAEPFRAVYVETMRILTRVPNSLVTKTLRRRAPI